MSTTEKKTDRGVTLLQSPFGQKAWIDARFFATLAGIDASAHGSRPCC